MKSVIQYWHVIESLAFQDLEKLNGKDNFHPVLGLEFTDEKLPWQVDSNIPRSPGRKLFFSLQCGVFKKSSITKLLLNAFRVKEDPTQVFSNDSGSTRLFDLVMDEFGLPVIETFALSLSAWVSSRLVSSGGDLGILDRVVEMEFSGLPVVHDAAYSATGYDQFDRLQESLREYLRKQRDTMKAQSVCVTKAWLQKTVAMISERVGLANLEVMDFKTLAVAKVMQLSKTPTAAIEILSSFYTQDLRRLVLEASRNNSGVAFNQFLSGANIGRAHRIDVRSQQANSFMQDALGPNKFPIARWPSDHALVFSQQLAVNEITQRAVSGLGSLSAVNGPPGTGKTTMLRDVVAHVVSQRAIALQNLGERSFGPKSTFHNGVATVPFYPLHSSLYGHSLVVASSNNGAVENVTLELPSSESVPKRVQTGVDYFNELSEKLSGKPSWGLISAALGNKKNRVDFLEKFWWSKSEQGQVSMRSLLKNIESGSTSPCYSYKSAAAAFEKSVQAEAESRSRIQVDADLPKTIESLSAELMATQKPLEELYEVLDDTEWTAQEGLTKYRAAAAAHEQLRISVLASDSALKNSCAGKPYWLQNLLSLGTLARNWKRAHTSLETSHQALVRSMKQAETQLVQALEQSSKCTSDANSMKLRITSLTVRIEALYEVLDLAKQAHCEAEIRHGPASWLRVDSPACVREKLTVWANESWLKDRENVFLNALKLHRAFIEGHPRQMQANLALAADWLAGKPMPIEVAKVALASLSLVVPVISTTFASMSRMFASHGREAIGWLLVDEAGQAVPAHAVGSIWRAQNVVVVGDPRQLEPVFTVPQQLAAEIARMHHVPAGMVAANTSVQSLADQVSQLGTYMPSVGQDDDTWVGMPLRLHRRCAEPMFSVSNEIAYGGLMVNGKPNSSNDALPESGWINVRSQSDSHWIAEEGRAATTLIKSLIHGGHRAQDIAVITPFRECAVQLKRIMGTELALDDKKVGTIHTSQGKEAEVVVLILGGKPSSLGAKAWASSKPNLLNVAVTRAKSKLYVIGNHELWSKYEFFRVLAERLPFSNADQANIFV